MAELFVLATIVILLIQPGHDFMKSSLPIIIGVVITAAVGEILVARSVQRSQSVTG
jgi:multisubunit Na+/H+ antiporter MnhG subunit